MTTLRSRLIRLAHSKPELRGQILPLLKEAGPAENHQLKILKDTVKNPMKGKFLGGPSAEEAEETLREKFKFTDKQIESLKKAHLLKEAGCEKLPEGGMHNNCEKKKEEGKESASKKASSVTIRKTVSMRVRILTQKPGGGDMSQPSPETQNLVVVTGQISLDFGGDIAPDAIRFRAVLEHGGGFPWAPGLIVQSFQTLKTVSGGGADILLGVLKSALQEALNQRGESLLDTKE